VRRCARTAAERGAYLAWVEGGEAGGPGPEAGQLGPGGGDMDGGRSLVVLGALRESYTAFQFQLSCRLAR
jgi:hypothetical protein